jgi:hypothetical protein
VSKALTDAFKVSLTCFDCREYDSCKKRQEPPVHLSCERTTLLTCFQDLRKRLQDRHDKYEVVTTIRDLYLDVSGLLRLKLT